MSNNIVQNAALCITVLNITWLPAPPKLRDETPFEHLKVNFTGKTAPEMQILLVALCGMNELTPRD